MQRSLLSCHRIAESCVGRSARIRTDHRRFTKDGDALFLAEATAIIFQLLIELGMPFRMNDPFEDFADQILLFCGVELAVDFWSLIISCWQRACVASRV